MTSSALDAPGAPACLVELADRLLAVEIGEAREAREFPELTVVPLAPPLLIGMANLRGAILPVLDLRLLLGLPPRPRARTIRTLVVEAGGVRLAISVDRVVGVESLELEASAPSGDEASGFERGRFVRGETTVPILDVASMVEVLRKWKP